MEYRLGTCSSCNSQFRVPASFKADRAKCKKCAGVVELGPVLGSAEPAAARPARPAAKPAREPAAMAPVEPIPLAPPPPAPRPVPAKPVAGARPSAPAPGPAPAAKAPVPEPMKPAAAKAVEAERKSVREAAAEAASRVQAAGVAPKRHGSTRSARRGGKRGETKSKTGVLIGTAALLAGAIGIGWFLFGKDEPGAAQAAESEPSAAAAPVESEAAPAEAEAAPQPAEAPAPELAGEGSAPAAAAPAEPGAEPAAEPAAAEAPEPAPEITGVDLATLAPFGKLAETADADWVAHQELAATFVDPAAGAEGNRARAKLLAAGYQAIPAIVNEMLAIDVATTAGYRTGDLLQKLLMEMCRGSNFGWKYSTSAEDQAFNQKVVQAWHKAWAGVEADRKAWIQLGKLSEEEGQELLADLAGASEEAAPADAPEELEDF